MAKSPNSDAKKRHLISVDIKMSAVGMREKGMSLSKIVAALRNAHPDMTFTKGMVSRWQKEAVKIKLAAATKRGGKMARIKPSKYVCNRRNALLLLGRPKRSKR